MKHVAGLWCASLARLLCATQQPARFFTISLGLVGCASATSENQADASIADIDRRDGSALESYSQPMAAAPDLAAMRELPMMHGVRYRAQTSTDRGGMTFDGISVDNKDFNNFTAVCNRAELPAQVVDGTAACDDGIDGYVLVSADDGPGVITRIFVTGLSWKNERIRIYADDLATPRIDMLVADWVDGIEAPLAQWTSSALVSYVPVAYRSKLRIVLDEIEPSAFVYYQVELAQLPNATALASVDPDALRTELENAAAARDPDASDMLTLRPGTTTPIFAADGGGTIERLELSVSPPSALDQLTLAAHWDDQREAAISTPLATLFGCFDELASFETAPMAVRVDDAAVTLRLSLPMPYRRGAKLTLENTGMDEAQVTVNIALGAAPATAHFGRLHALAHERRAPIATGERYDVAALNGRGKYVGTLARFAGGADPDPDHDWPYDFSFLEGDEHITIDGVRAVQGTGTEDYFNGGWYFADGLYSSPFSALINLASDTPGTGRATMLRWHIGYDAIEFQSDLDFELEYGNDDPATVSDYRSIAFYYLE